MRVDLKRLLFGEPMSRDKVDSSVHSLSLCDARLPDAPLVYVNKGFENLTGYTPAEAIGRNCRFLQGADTDPAAVARIRAAVAAGAPLLVDLVNYRKDGRPFVNRLSLRPVHGPDGELTHIVGIQTDITAIKALEERLHGFALELGGHPGAPA